MIKKETEIVIIGAGLTGLTLAYLLKDNDVDVLLVEARERIGGRIWTRKENDEPTIELGATWLGKKHTQLVYILNELGIGSFEQKLGKTAIYEPISTSPFQIVDLPLNQDPSYRIKGGSESLITALSKSLKSEQFIHDKVQTIESTANEHSISCQKVVSTLPPYLFQHTIKTIPSLPDDLLDIAQQTHTWMGESIKVAVVYDQPFWNKGRLSGTIVSNVGPIPEMYDHSNIEDTHFALKGFLNGSYYSVSKAERQELVLGQLEKYYGPQARDFTSYHEKVWKFEAHTSADYQHHILPHQNNGDSIFRKTYLDNRLFIAGSETSAEYPGYMEGAIRSAQFVFGALDI